MTSSARKRPTRPAPHPYQTKPPVNVTWKAMQIVRHQWIVAGIDRDTAEEVLAVAGGKE